MTSSYSGPSPNDPFETVSEHFRYIHSPDDDLRYRAASHLEDYISEVLGSVADAIAGSAVVAVLLEPHEIIREKLLSFLAALDGKHRIVRPIMDELVHGLEGTPLSAVEQSAVDSIVKNFEVGDHEFEEKYADSFELRPLSQDFMPTPGWPPDGLIDHLRNLQSDDPGEQFTAAYHLPARFEEYHTYPISVAGCVVIARLFEVHSLVAEAQRNALHDLGELADIPDEVLQPVS
ncbi:MAG: hypothetical protein ACN4GZ_01720 [Acidimicrobiales bacterium]